MTEICKAQVVVNIYILILLIVLVGWKQPSKDDVTKYSVYCGTFYIETESDTDGSDGVSLTLWGGSGNILTVIPMEVTECPSPCGEAVVIF